MRQVVDTAADVAVGVLRGFASSVTGGLIGAPKETDSVASRLGQAGGAGLAIVAGTDAAITGGAATVLTSGASSPASVPLALVGVGAVAGGLVNATKVVTTPIHQKSGTPTLSEHKDALNEVHREVGKLPKGNPGKFGSPQRGTPKKGYRLDPGHPGKKTGDPERGRHVNWWDYTKGKRGSGGRSGTVPVGRIPE